MKTCLKYVLLAMALYLCLECTTVFGYEYSEVIPEYSDSVITEVTGYAGFADIIESIADREAVVPEDLLHKIVYYAVGDVRYIFKYIVSVLAVCILASCVKGAYIGLKGASGEISFLVCYCTVSGFLLGILNDCVKIALSASESIVIFVRMALPAYIGIITSTGVNAASSEGIFLVMVNVISSYVGNFMINAFFFTGILTVVSNMSAEIKVNKLIHIFRQVMFWILGFLLTVFAGMTSLSGLNISASSGSGIRAIKYTIGHTVPVVGGFLADSTELIYASAGIFKTAFGTAGIVILGIVTMVPVIKLFLVGFLVRITAGLAEPFCDRQICDTVFSVGQTIIYIMVSLLLMTVMFIFAFAVLLKL